MEQEVQLIYPLIRMPVSEIPCFVINLILDCIKQFYFQLIYPREKAFSGNIFSMTGVSKHYINFFFVKLLFANRCIELL